MPHRVQRKRTRGYRMPDNTISVARPGRWGNPFHWQDELPHLCEYDKKQSAVAHFTLWLAGKLYPNHDQERRRWMLENLNSLRGKNLACFCSDTEPCHADILLELANK